MKSLLPSKYPVLFSGIKPALSLDFTQGILDPRITFARASNATLVDSTGKIKYAPANHLLRSDDISHASWNTTTNTSVATDTDTGALGGLTADTLTATGANGVRQQGITTVADSYTYSVYLKRKTGTGNIDITMDGTTWVTQTITTSLARYSVTQTCAAGTSNPGIRIVTNADAVYVDASQVERTSYDSPQAYNPTTTAAYYGPRFDYNPTTLAPLGLLIEEQRTNKVLYSEAISDTGSWNKILGGPTTITVTTNSTDVLDPSGTNKASKLVFSASSGANVTKLYQQVTSTGAHTISMYLRGGVGGETIYLIGYNGSAYFTTTCNLTTSWQRFSVSSATGTGDFIQIGREPAAGNGDISACTVYAYGAQLEAGAFATSYIPTTTASATRVADSASMTGTNFSSWYNQTEGTFVVHLKTAHNATLSGNARIIGLNSGAGGQYCTPLYSPAVDNGVRAFNNITAQSNIATFGSGGYSTGAKVAYSTSLGASQASIVGNNGTVVNSSTATMPADISALYLGSRAGTNDFINCTMSRFVYYTKRLPDAKLQQLTA